MERSPQSIQIQFWEISSLKEFFSFQLEEWEGDLQNALHSQMSERIESGNNSRKSSDDESRSSGGEGRKLSRILSFFSRWHFFIFPGFYLFYPVDAFFLSHICNLGKTSKQKTHFNSGIARMCVGGGGLPLPEFFWHFFQSRKRSWRPDKVGKVARIGGWGGVWVIRAMPELKCVFCFDVFPKYKCDGIVNCDDTS